MSYLPPSAPHTTQPSLEELARSLFELIGADQLLVYRRYEAAGPYDPLLALGALALQDKQAFWSSQLEPASVPPFAPGQLLSAGGEAAHALLAGSALAEMRPRAWRVYPLANREQNSGLVLAGWLGDPPTLPETRLALASLLAGAMALHLDNDRLYERLHQQGQQARIAQEVTQSILRSDGLTEILKFIAGDGMRSLDALGCCMWLFEEDGALRPAVCVGRPFPSPLDPSHSPAAAREALLQLDQPLALPVTPGSDDDEPTLILMVPLLSSQRSIGFLEINQVAAYHQPRDLAAAAAFAGQAAVAVELAWLSRRLQQTAVAEERARLARDLHDSISQSLYAMTLYTRAAQRRLGENNLASVEKHLGQLHATARQVLGEMRLLIYELRPMALERYGLKGILEQRLQSVEARSGLEYRLAVDLPAGLPARIEEHFYHIALEALNNTIKHGQASHVSVEIQHVPGAVRLDIHDDGAGFDPADETGGLGLKSIQERVSLLNGQLSIDTRPDAGVAIHVEVPYDQDPHPDR